MKKIALAAIMLAVSTGAAFAQAGTVDAHTAADEAKAKAAVTAAGYTPGVVASSQAGNLYLTATKGTDKYFVTVTADGHVYPGPALGAAPQVPVTPLSLPPGSPAPSRGPRNGGGD